MSNFKLSKSKLSFNSSTREDFKVFDQPIPKHSFIDGRKVKSVKIEFELNSRIAVVNLRRAILSGELDRLLAVVETALQDEYL